MAPVLSRPTVQADHGSCWPRCRRSLPAAAARADEHYFGGVTVTQQAPRLAGRGASLYHHLAGRGALPGQTAARAFSELADRLAGGAIGKARDEAVVGAAEVFHDEVRAPPGRYAATAPSLIRKTANSRGSLLGRERPPADHLQHRGRPAADGWFTGSERQRAKLIAEIGMKLARSRTIRPGERMAMTISSPPAFAACFGCAVGKSVEVVRPAIASLPPRSAMP